MDLQKRTKKDYINLLNETIEYYKEHPLSILPFGRCRYYDSRTGTKCAVGRCLNLANYSEDWEDKGVIQFDKTHGLEENLQNQYKGYDIRFWQLLQGMHDNYSLWADNSLSKDGECEKQNILDWIEENVE